MKKCFLLVLSLVLAFASPAIAAMLSPHTNVTESSRIVQSINNYNSETYTAGTDLVLGTTTRYQSDGSPHVGGLDGADNFDLTTQTSRQDSSDNTLAYIETIFGDGETEAYDTFFIFERHGDEDGWIEAIYETGLGDKISFSNRGGQFGDTGIQIDNNKNINAWLAVYELTSPAIGIRITNEDPSGNAFDALSISAVGTPIPIPGAVWLLGSGLVGVIFLRRKRSVK
jgi:hypothetical protein